MTSTFIHTARQNTCALSKLKGFFVWRCVGGVFVCWLGWVLVLVFSQILAYIRSKSDQKLCWEKSIVLEFPLGFCTGVCFSSSGYPMHSSVCVTGQIKQDTLSVTLWSNPRGVKNSSHKINIYKICVHCSIQAHTHNSQIPQQSSTGS